MQDAVIAVLRPDAILVGAPQTRGQLVELSADGRFRREIGKTGEGPGELRFVTGMTIGDGDTIYVADSFGRTLHRFDSDGEFVDRTLMPGGVQQFVPLGGARTLVAGDIPTRSAAGFPLHLVEHGRIVRSFGTDTSNYGPGAAAFLARRLARAQNNRVWAAHRLAYRIELWDTTGTLVQTLSRRVDWFPPARTYRSVSPQAAPPPPQITGIHDDGAGLLWVYILVADASWKRGTRRVVSSGAHTGDSTWIAEVWDPFFDTVIELIDLRRNVVVASLRENRRLTSLGGGYLSSYELDAEGNPAYRLWRPMYLPSNPPE